MSSIPEEISKQLAGRLVKTATAANADRLGEHRSSPTHGHPHEALTETASGWDSYEVWRRFIKDARDRRHSRRS